MHKRDALLSLSILLLAAGGAAAAEQSYAVDVAESRMTISVDKSGMFSFAGHQHEILATAIEGTVVADAADVARSSVKLRFGSAGLKVSGKGEPPEDVPKVQERMAGPETLDVARFAEIEFHSTLVEGREAPAGTWNLRVTGDLTIHGQTQKLTLPIRVQLAGDALTASGQAVIKQTDFGIKPISIGGVVKVKNELGLDYKIVGKAAH